jgi:hypothetical protein
MSATLGVSSERMPSSRGWPGRPRGSLAALSAAELPRGATSTEGDAGSIGLELTLPGAAMIATITYTVTGPNGAGNLVTTGSVPQHRQRGAGSGDRPRDRSGPRPRPTPPSGAATLTCLSQGLVTVTFVFADGPLPTGASRDPTLDGVSFPVQCEGPDLDGGGPDAGPTLPVELAVYRRHWQ